MFAGGFAGGFARRFAGAVFALGALGALAAAGALGTLGAAPLEAQMAIGVRAGIGPASLTGAEGGPRSGSAFEGPRYGFMAGVDADLPVTGGLGLRVGMALHQKGGATEIPASITAGRAFVETMAEFDYVQFSALVRANVAAEGGGLRFGVLAGPYVALNASCNVAVRTVEPQRILPVVPPGDPNLVPSMSMTEHDVDNVDQNIPCGEGGTPAIESSEYGLAFGAGFEARLTSSLRLAFELIYARGLSEIDDKARKTNHFTVQTGLIFPIG